MQFKYQSYSATHVGKKRTNNEDAYGELDVAQGKIFVVCDGMGGHVAGERASAIAVQTILDYFKTVALTDIPESIKEAIQHANKNIWDEALNDPSLKGMGTTCVVVFIHTNGEIYIGHVGDSRCYLFTANKKLSTLTRDHSYVQFLIETGDVKPEEAFDHPSKNRILKALGIEATVTPEVIEQAFRLSSGDSLLLCTDGLNDMLRDQEIQEVLTNHSSPETQVTHLIDEALEKGGKDNITLTLIQVNESPCKSKATTITQEKTPQNKQEKKKWIGFILIVLVLLAGLMYLFLPFNQESETTITPYKNNLQDTLQDSNDARGKKIKGENIPMH